MTSGALIDGVAVVEPFVMVAAGAAVVLLVVDRLVAGERRVPSRSLDDAIAPRTEYALLASIVAVAMGLRLVGWDSGITPSFWFSEISTLHVDRLLQSGTLWTEWVRELSMTDVLGPHDAALVLPVLVGVQKLIGPRFGLPVVSGALFGSLGVLLAWALGRRVRSPAFGLVFAALVAFSPLALTWSRLSGFCVAAGTHVLLAMLVGYEAGRRGSVLLALATGLVAWTSIYHYYAARVGIPLALAALVAGSQRARRLRRGLVLAVVATAVFVGIGYYVHGDATLRVLWPSYGGYAGNKGERTLAEFVAQNVASFQVELTHTLERYFTARRLGWNSDVRLPGMANGGLTLLPIALLGLVGLVAVVRRLRSQWLWLLFAAAGLALPTVSVMTARRTLMFDVAWCALAAHGLLALIDGVGARWTFAMRARVAAIVVALVGAWSAAAVFLLSAAVADGTAQQIPFGDAGFGDGVTCRRCLEAAKGWSREMADGAFVVLFDNDVLRENRTSPGGLIAYGKIATLVAGTPGRFVEGYGLMAGIDLEPPTPGVLFSRNQLDFVTYLTNELDRTAPTRIVWHFERPTSWERWLARQLVAAGGTKETFATPLSLAPGVRVVTPWARRADAMAVLDKLAAGLAPEADSSCITLAQRNAFATDATIIGLAADGPGVDAKPDWLALSFTAHRYRTFVVPTPLLTVGARVNPGANDTAKIELFLEHGQLMQIDLPSLKTVSAPAMLAGRYALNCAAHAAGHWWVVDPWTGKVTSTHPAATALPKGQWIGVGSDPSGAVVLVSGDQWVVIFDPQRRTEVVRFRARVPPSVRQMADECTPVAVSAYWIALADLRTGVLSVYDRSGRDFGTRRLDVLTSMSFPLTAVAGAGHYLAVALGTTVRTFELRTDPDCPSGG